MEWFIIETHANEYPRWTQKVTMGGSLYKLYFSWNERQEIWQLSISDSDDNLLLGGLCLVPEIDLLSKYRVSVPKLPVGMLIVMDKMSDLSAAEITRDNFGSRFLLGYFDFGEA